MKKSRDMIKIDVYDMAQQADVYNMAQQAYADTMICIKMAKKNLEKICRASLLARRKEMEVLSAMEQGQGQRATKLAKEIREIAARTWAIIQGEQHENSDPK